MSDNYDKKFRNYFRDRTSSLDSRFPGWWRAVITETNDPLRMGRIKIKIPEIHDFDLSPEDCQWAVSAPGIGGKGSGSWDSPMIGDHVWVAFEKNHPYAPIWVGSADATRRR